MTRLRVTLSLHSDAPVDTKLMPHFLMLKFKRVDKKLGCLLGEQRLFDSSGHSQSELSNCINKRQKGVRLAHNWCSENCHNIIIGRALWNFATYGSSKDYWMPHVSIIQNTAYCGEGKYTRQSFDLLIGALPQH